MVVPDASRESAWAFNSERQAQYIEDARIKAEIYEGLVETIAKEWLKRAFKRSSLSTRPIQTVARTRAIPLTLDSAKDRALMEQLRGHYTPTSASMSMHAGDGGNGSGFDEVNRLSGPKTLTVGMVRSNEEPPCLFKTLDIIIRNCCSLYPDEGLSTLHISQELAGPLTDRILGRAHT